MLSPRSRSTQIATAKAPGIPLAKTPILVHSPLIISLYCHVMICVYPLALAFLNNHSNST